MSIAAAAPFSGLSLPANTAPSPAASDQGTERVGTYGGRIASTGVTVRQALAWDVDTHPTAGGRLPWLAIPSATATPASGGRWGGCTKGASRPPARLDTGPAEAGFWYNSVAGLP